MTLPHCTRCGQPRTGSQLYRGICGSCRRHRCTKHRPGSAACYTRHGCLCQECRQALRRQEKTRQHFGSGRVPASVVADHLQVLLQTMGRAEIGRLSGIHSTNLAHIIDGRQATIHQDLAAALLAIKPVPIRQQLTGEVDGCGTTRRVRALMYAGWWPTEISRRSGVPTEQILRVANGAPRVFARTRALIDAAYGKLWDQSPPPCRSHLDARARNRALREGWSAALSWDDDMGPHGIDNPAATPVTGTPRKLRTATEKIEEIEALAGSASSDEIAKRLGYRDADSMATTLTRAGHPDVARKIREAA